MSRKRPPRLTLQQFLDFGVFRDTERRPSGDQSETVVVKSDGRSVAQGKSVGFSVAGAAKRLGVVRQRVHQLVQSGRLDAYELLDDAKCTAGLFITRESVEAFERSGRKPGPKPKGQR